MTDILHITMYGTEHCHLCEQAHEIVQQVSKHFPCQIKRIDITLDDKLFQEYATSIPVIHIQEFNQILNWPFSMADVIQAISKHRL